MQLKIILLLILAIFVGCSSDKKFNIDCKSTQVYKFNTLLEVGYVHKIKVEILKPCCSGNKLIITEKVKLDDVNEEAFITEVKAKPFIEVKMDSLAYIKENDWYSSDFSIIHEGVGNCSSSGEIRVTVYK